MTAEAATTPAAHRRVAAGAAQRAFIAFGGGADLPWLWPLRRGFRHCFAALRDAEGWTVLDPLSRRLLVTRLAVEAEFDLPGFWRRAGCRVLGPFLPAAPAQGLPSAMPFSCCCPATPNCGASSGCPSRPRSSRC